MLHQSDGTLTEEDSEIASLLNDYFCSIPSIYTKENLSIIPIPNPRLHDDLLSNISKPPHPHI